MAVFAGIANPVCWSEGITCLCRETLQTQHDEPIRKKDGWMVNHPASLRNEIWLEHKGRNDVLDPLTVARASFDV